MLENNWKTWVVLLIAFFGAGIELLKHLPGRETVKWESDNLHYGMDSKPYSVRNQLPLKVKLAPPPAPQAKHIAGDQKVLAQALKSYTATTAPQATEAEHKADPAKAADKDKKKKKNEDEYEEVIDPVTGKKVKRKKKKEAKKEEQKKPTTVEASKPITKPEDDGEDEPSDAAAIAAAIATSIETGEVPPPNKKKNTDPFMSQAEWERMLLSRPDLGATKQFIQAFKNHTVSSDVYYKIAKLMIADSRPEMKSLGVMVVGSNNSVMSFQILAGIAASGSGEPKSNAQRYISAYSNSIANVQILLGVLRGTDTVAASAALRQFDIAANKFLANSTTSTGGNPSRGTAAQFQPFVAVLTTLSGSSDGSLAAQAANSLNRLQNLLGTSGSQTGNLAQTP